jgi:3-oxoacyl-[acyl-carrier-protein] synthase-1
MKGTTQPVAIFNAGLVTSVGLSAPAACAAIRAALTNHSETQFIDASGEPMLAAQVPLEQPWRGRERLTRMLAMCINEVLVSVESAAPPIPLLLCVAERQRPGRQPGLDDDLFRELSDRLDVHFDSQQSSVIAYGRVAVSVALARARSLLYEKGAERVLIAATDSLLQWPTLAVYQEQRRLLADGNSNGFIPGEAAGALIVAKPSRTESNVSCIGLGFGEERAPIDSEEPLRGDGLATAIKTALGEAGCGMHELDFRIADITGEQYYFKEASLAMSRTLRQRKTEFDIWHPTDCVGEIGAAIGAVALAVALAAFRKGYAPGPAAIFHSGNDAGQRAAVILRYQEAA